jgi:starvation-inducible DNA-binding protein
MNKKVINQLNSVFANSYFLYMKSQNYHWNIVGRNFTDLHALFEGFYKDLGEALDLLAERMRTLEVKIPLNLEYLRKLQIIREGDENKNSREMLEDLYRDHLRIAELLNDLIKVAKEEDDEVTIDIAIERLRVHEKNTWIIRSILE